MVSIAITGGGTGGHIYPGLAIASQLTKLENYRIIWIGSSSGMDRAVVERSDFEFFGIPSGKLRRYISLQNLLDIFKVLAGFFAALRILKRERPALLFSKGGFVSVPPCAAASLLKIPVFTHESDFSPGLATRINARFAERIFVPYSESVAFFRGAYKEKVQVSGNPIRVEFAEADSEKGRAFLGLGNDERILLVLGGSLGSREINSLIVDCLSELTGYYTVVHQTGENKTQGSEGAERYMPHAYFQDEMPDVIAAAELVVCRSGANTIWECKYLCKPMVLIPLRGSGTRGDQVENARLFQEAGAALCFTETSGGGDLSRERFSSLIASLASDPEKRKKMAESKIAETDASAFIAEEIVHRIGRRN